MQIIDFVRAKVAAGERSSLQGATDRIVLHNYGRAHFCTSYQRADSVGNTEESVGLGAVLASYAICRTSQIIF